MSRTGSRAPIALFVFNRPDHTERTLKALQQNVLAADSHLYVFCDGARSSDDQAAVSKVRSIVRSEKWCGTVTVVEQKANFGLADSIKSGIDRVLSKHDRIIVLEDDIETTPGFLTFMNEALDIYLGDERVMNISGYLPETSYQNRLPETFFVQLVACWGWATWKRAWQHARWDAADLLSELNRSSERMCRFNIDGSYSYSGQLERNRDGEIKTWAVYWAATCFLKDGLSLFPKRSMVRNIGLDGSGENCHAGQDDHNRYQTAESVAVSRVPVQESPAGRDHYRRFYSLGRNSSRKKRALLRTRQFRNRLLQRIPESLKEPIRNLTGSQHPFGLAHSEQKRLAGLPRFQQTETRMFGKPLQIVDAASFLASHDEIFRQHIYRLDNSITKPVIFDVGANIGLASIYLKRLFPEASITSIESDSEVCNVLKENLSAFDFDDVHVHEGAAWVDDSELRFQGNQADAGRVSEEGEVTVQGIRLRDLIADQPIDFLKMDIEGAETTVLKDCEPVLSNVKTMFVEFHSFASSGQTLSELLGILQRQGFRYYLDRTGVYSHRPLIKLDQESGFDLQMNVFAIRPDSL